MALDLRPASRADLALLRHWDRQQHVVDAFDGHPIGMIQIIDPAEAETHDWRELEANRRAIDIWIGAAADLSR